MTSRFERDTAVTRIAAHHYEGRMDEGWWILRGPNGGYVAAVLLRALTAAVGDPERAPRSLTLHYTSPPTAGPVSVETRIERQGRSLTTVSARMSQAGQLRAVAIAAFSKSRPAPHFRHAVMPEVTPPEKLPRLQLTKPGPLPIHARYDYRWAVGTPPGEGPDKALCGGWIRLQEPHPIDAAVLAAFADAWPPAVFFWAPPGELLRGAPTVDLTVHFRTPLPHPGIGPEDFLLAVFRSREASDGFVEEDGEIWSRNGVLLAHSRQLAMIG